ncbi:MAG: nitroreductase family protein [Lachnospiraceae bacterium]|nr:nitroreductase family protein [Lachnospiraceae bacterium]
MEFQKVIEARQSVRKFNGKQVSEDIIREMISAAKEAPSWKNSQTSRYYCVVSPDQVAKFRETVLPVFNQNSTADATAYIVTTFKKGIAGFTQGTADNEVGDGWGAYDLGLHDMLLCAKAVELGVDTLIMGLRDANVVAEFCGIPDDEQVMCIIAVGYRADDVSKKPGRKAVDDIAKFVR